jgi:hypothetical protein
MNMEAIEVKDGHNGFKLIEGITRVPRRHVGWWSTTYKNKRYQVFGGIRGPLFIDIANPLKSRKAN